MNTLKDYVNFRLTHADKLAEAKGYPLELYDCKKYKPMRDLKIYGESVQDGVPTPETPIEVQCVGDLSVNLVKDAREVFKDFSGYTEVAEDGRECIHIKSNSSAKAILDFTFKKNTQYTISFDFKCEYAYSGVSLEYDVPFVVYYTDGNRDICNLSPIDNTWNKRVLTTKAGKTVSHISGISFDYRVYNYIDINTFQIEEGVVATEYQPYYDGYKIPVVVKGKNLATAYDVCKNLSTYTEITLDGRECVSYRSNYGFSYAYTDYPIKENTQYTVSFYVKSVKNHTLTGNNMIMGFTYTDGTAPTQYNKDCVYNNNDGVNDVEWRKVTITSQAGKTVKGFG
ncbi:MAG: hypothetical protein J6V03_03560, partial [Clostridia bacterium]|nr:hypothetical protein [Clostridia bacterium]